MVKFIRDFLDNLGFYLIIGGLFVWYFFSEMLITVPVTQKDDMLIKEVIQIQKEDSYIYLREQLDADVFSNNEVREIAECSDKKIIEFVESFPETYSIETPKFSSQEQLNQHVEEIFSRKVPELNYGLSKWTQIATNSCMTDVKL